MNHDFSLEPKITRGIAQYIKEIKTDLNNLKITFFNIKNNKETYLELIGFNNLSVYLDSPEDIAVNQNDLLWQSLIGFSFDKIDNIFRYCIKTDDYELMFESKNFLTIRYE